MRAHRVLFALGPALALLTATSSVAAAQQLRNSFIMPNRPVTMPNIAMLNSFVQPTFFNPPFYSSPAFLNALMLQARFNSLYPYGLNPFRRTYGGYGAWGGYGGVYGGYGGGYGSYAGLYGYGGYGMSGGYSSGYAPAYSNDGTYQKTGYTANPYGTKYGAGNSYQNSYGVSYGERNGDSTRYLPDSANASVDVEILDGSFEPKESTFLAGTTVRWTNRGQRHHTVASDDGLWKSGDLAPGETFGRKFSQPGSYSYQIGREGGEVRGTLTVR
jgi:plastocyanin